MTKINDFSVYQELQVRYPRNISNDFMLPSEIQKRIGQGMINISADERALFMFERRHGFYKLHFRIIDIAAEIPRSDGSIAAFLIYRRDRYPAEAADWLHRQGFVHTKTLMRLSSNEITGELTYEGIDNASADEVYEMFGRHFSVEEADLPCREVFDEKGIYCIRSAEGKPLGIVYDMKQTRIIAVSGEARGQGIGRRLYLAYAAVKLRENKNHVFKEWVSPDNKASLAMYHSLGFVQDSTVSDCFVRGSL